MGIGASTCSQDTVIDRGRGRSRIFFDISEFKCNRTEGIMASERHADESGWGSREPKTKRVSKELSSTSRKKLNIDVV